MTIEPTVDESVNAQRILQAAFKLFASKGYSATSIREIVQEAQVTNPMVYYYFGNKEGLFQGLLDSMQTDYHQKILERTDRCDNAADFAREIIAVEVQGFRERPEVFRFVYGVLFGPPGSSPSHDLYERHKVLESKLVATWRTFVPDGGDAIGLLFALIHAWIMGALKIWEETPDSEKESYLNRIGDQDVEELSRFFLRGIGVQ